MNASASKFCAVCGAALHPEGRFCESCGSRVDAGGAGADAVSASPVVVTMAPAEGGERLVGQMPCAWVLEKKGLFGRHPERQGNLLITNRRLVFLHETSASNEEEMYEDERLDEEARSRGIELSEVVRNYDWFSGPGRRFLDSPVDELRHENRENWEIPLSRVRRARLWPAKDDSPEKIEIEIEEDSTREFTVFRAASGAVKGWLISLLGTAAVMDECW